MMVDSLSRRNANQRPERSPGRRRFLRRLLGVMIGVPAAAAGYARFIEPLMLRQRTLHLSLPRLPQAFNGLTIAHLTDIHFGHHMSAERLQQVVDDIQAAEPDLICLTGDLVEDCEVSVAQAIPVLRQLTAPLGKFAVLGNHDYERGMDLASEAFEASGFQVLKNESHLIERHGAVVAVAGIDDALKGIPDMNAALRGIAADTCSILLAHEPDWGKESLNYPIDLQLSGHSHGGQVRLPFFGPLLLPRLGTRYPDGLYELERTGGETRSLFIYTSRGIGTTVLPIRFSCPPEWTIITLSKS
ncbi:metallophosphoesterase [Paenibacillus sp. OSY-SE]|uniref:metallophosphoesterase n=1 Tax=Paenibacillus sp. OSY-SE TaxID=1196323 RepID=UPI0002F79BAE|nr:metallophosphoesterase [Paenibacillus sp. OSY-SE]